jgi:hypothetical protein
LKNSNDPRKQPRRGPGGRGFLVWFFLLLSFPVFAQEPPDPGAGLFEEESSPEDEGALYYIRHINFDITGRTRPFALIQRGELKAGEQLKGKKALEGYIQEKVQLLVNQRVLETVGIDYTLGAAEEDGAVPVDLLVRVRDTWNIIAIPYPKYDSNTGFELTIKARDYNFLGTMSPLRIDLGYSLAEDDLWNFGRGAFSFELDSDTPFNALGYNWNFNFDHIFSYTYGEPLSYKNVTGISMELPYRWTTFTFGFEEDFILYEENKERYKAQYGEHFNGYYFSSELFARWKIPLGLEVFRYGELSWTPKLSGKINYRPMGELDDIRKGPALSFDQTLGFGRVNWIGNYRSGAEALAENTNVWNFYQASWNSNISLSLIYHKPFTSFFGISGRFQYRHWFDPYYPDDYYDEGGDALRGVLNRSLNTRAMLSLNVDFPLRALRFMPSEWLHNRKLHFFDFELHASPFADLALMDAPLNNKKFSPGDMIFSGGLELILFPAFMRSIYLRISLGYNLNEFAAAKKIPSGSNREIFIGLGHFY